MFDGGYRSSGCGVSPLLRLLVGRLAVPGVGLYPTVAVLLVRRCIGRFGTPCGTWCGPALVTFRPRVGDYEDEICVGGGGGGLSKGASGCGVSTTQSSSAAIPCHNPQRSVQSELRPLGIPMVALLVG